jgi:hypothetical protein
MWEWPDRFTDLPTSPPLLSRSEQKRAERAEARRQEAVERDAAEWRRICRNPPRVRWSRLEMPLQRLGGW